MDPEKTLCIYHNNCADGFGAAWVVRRALGKHVEFHAANHGDAPPDVRGRTVLIVDFSYKRPVLLEMAEVATSITILDHHRSAEKDLVDLPGNVTAEFDMDRSGAMMAWDHFFPGRTPPVLIAHIQDRDLWQFELPGTREIQACLFSYPYDFEAWDKLMHTYRSNLLADGKAIERKHFKDIAEFRAAAQHTMVIAGYEVPVLNVPYFYASDAGHQMAEDAPFAACYWDTPEGRTFSLRSREGGVDVSEIAARFGGGGHRHAAGFRISRDHLWASPIGPVEPERT
ncbi:MAG: phosphohydrolase [Oceanospirillaceae bacterium]|nr:phosphohydrolase [Oceanospirillaceae bacterium]